MPQLDFGNPLMISQVVWLLLIFGVLYYVLANYALPRVGAVLEARRETIARDLEAARAAKAAADAAIAEQQAASRKANAEAQAAISSAMQQAQDSAAKKAAELSARLAQQVEEAEARIAAARTAAMGALRQVSVETTEALLQRLINTADQASIAPAVDRALAARGQA